MFGFRLGLVIVGGCLIFVIMSVVRVMLLLFMVVMLLMRLRL